MFEFPEKGVIISTEKIKSTSWTADRFQQSTVPTIRVVTILLRFVKCYLQVIY